MDIINQVATFVYGPHIDWKQVLLFGMLPLFGLSLGLEWLNRRMRKGTWQTGAGEGFDYREVFANLGLGACFYATEVLMHILMVGAIIATVWEHRIWTVPINAWTLPLIFVIEELCYYGYHRSAHRVRWFWSQHVSHHTGETMNMTTAARQSILTNVVGVWVFFLPPVLFGVHPAVIALMLGANLAYQWFIHTESVGKFHPVIEWLIDTPSNHRVHHGRNPQYIDKNFGGVLMIFDHLFGTYEPEVEKVEYGITRQIKSYNFLVLNVHEFVDMWRDALAPGHLWQRLKHFWKPPEWEREGHTPIHTWTIQREEGTQGDDTMTKRKPQGSPQPHSPTSAPT